MSQALQGIPLACPLDGLALDADDRCLVCPRGHAYDMSRHGYVNLLPVQLKPSREPGDDAAMVAARRRALDAGLFDPLAQALVDVAAECAASIIDSAPLLVDAGCGEGFYTNRLAERLGGPSGGLGAVGRRSGSGSRSGSGRVRVLGSDISRPAVTAAARRHRTSGWVVANNARLPVVQGAAGIITSLFGFETWEPWSALQSAGQWVVVVVAGPRHLIELREAIYDEVRIHEPPSDAGAVRAGYARCEERRASFRHEHVPVELLGDVLAMTPHAHRAPRSALATLASTRGMALSVDTVIRAYRRL